MDIREVRLFNNWWLLLLKGILILVVGAIYLSTYYFEALRPIFKIRVLMNTFIVITLINGVLILFGTFFYKKTSYHWMYWFLEGSFDVIVGVAGLIILSTVKITILNLFLVPTISLWALAHGVIHTLSARRLKRYVPISKYAIFAGILVILLSMTLMMKPFYSTIHDHIFIGSFLSLIGMLIGSISILLRKIYSD